MRSKEWEAIYRGQTEVLPKNWTTKVMEKGCILHNPVQPMVAPQMLMLSSSSIILYCGVMIICIFAANVHQI
jgi:hypothetical protein